MQRSRHPRPATQPPLPSPGMHRHCVRPGCGGEAVAALSYDYGARRVWLDFPGEHRVPTVYELCARHADRLTVPVGWVIDDQRTAVQPLFRTPLAG